MKLRLEKEIVWKQGESVIVYFVWADDQCIDVAYTEEEAYQRYENVKANYVPSGRQIVKEEEI